MNSKPIGSNVLELYIPQQDDGWFYIKLMSDPETMAYNATWFPPDGCIPNAEEEWEELYSIKEGILIKGVAVKGTEVRGLSLEYPIVKLRNIRHINFGIS